MQRATDDVSLSIRLIWLFVCLFAWMDAVAAAAALFFLSLVRFRSVCGWQFDKVTHKYATKYIDYLPIHKNKKRYERGEKRTNSKAKFKAVFRLLSFTFHTEFTFIAILLLPLIQFPDIFVRSLVIVIRGFSLCLLHSTFFLLAVMRCPFDLYTYNFMWWNRALCAPKRRQNVRTIVSESYAYHIVQIRNVEQSGIIPKWKPV